jgi:hypothetical protein
MAAKSEHTMRHPNTSQILEQSRFLLSDGDGDGACAAAADVAIGAAADDTPS